MNDHIELIKNEILRGRLITYEQVVRYASKNNLDFGPGVDVHTILRRFVDEGLIFIDVQGSFIFSRDILQIDEKK